MTVSWSTSIIGPCDSVTGDNLQAMAVIEIGVEELSRLADSGVRIVDVREAEEYVSGHIPGAISAPLSELPNHVEAFDQSETTYVVCQVGGRSMRACEFLDGNGYSVVNVAGGTGAWISAGYDVVLGNEPG